MRILVDLVFSLVKESGLPYKVVILVVVGEMIVLTQISILELIVAVVATTLSAVPVIVMEIELVLVVAETEM